MADRENRPARTWSGASVTEWRVDERAYAALLTALTRDRLETEAVANEMDASPVRSLADVQAANRQTARNEFSEARSELRDFREALDDARVRSGPDGRGEVAYDSADENQDCLSDVLIQYLVRADCAEVRTEEPDPGHYIYYIRVDWDRLEEIARAEGHSIDWANA